jgi:hypothetical protein
MAAETVPGGSMLGVPLIKPELLSGTRRHAPSAPV